MSMLKVLAVTSLRGLIGAQAKMPENYNFCFSNPTSDYWHFSFIELYVRLERNIDVRNKSSH